MAATPKAKPQDVRHGCPDCVSYKSDLKKEPCKSCERWSNWQDAHPDPACFGCINAGKKKGKTMTCAVRGMIFTDYLPRTCKKRQEAVT